MDRTLKGPLRGVDVERVGFRLIALIVVWALAPLSAASAEIYRWVDANGTPHYTDRAEEVPPGFREQLLGRGSPGSPQNNSFDGLALLPGEADGTSAGQAPEGWQTPEMPGELAEQAQVWLETAGAALIGGLIFMGLVAFGLFVAISALFLLMGCRVVGQERPGFKKAYGIVLVQLLAGALVAPGLVLVAGPGESTGLGGLVAYQAVSASLGILVNALVLRGMLTDSFLRALGIAVVTMLIIIGIGITLGVGMAILVPLLVVAAA
ncbi:MAG: DUF4124 domain-containing protein [Deltaproteobacteria bacterium]|nr:DUF4124 domain-containing protein [Deltaproteobacteria bacterium]